MPYVNVKVTPSITRDQKALLVQGITQVLVDVLGKNPAHTHIVIDEIDLANWGFAGMLTDDYVASQSQPQTKS